MTYVDGFVIPLAKKNVKAYRKVAAEAGRIWMKHGALQYCERQGDDLAPKTPGMDLAPSFPKMAKLKRGETVFFSWIMYKSRAHRDAVNKKVMADPKMVEGMKGPMPFDMKRMAYAGFKTVVEH